MGHWLTVREAGQKRREETGEQMILTCLGAQRSGNGYFCQSSPVLATNTKAGIQTSCITLTVGGLPLGENKTHTPRLSLHGDSAGFEGVGI